MELKTRLRELIKQGEELMPKGGHLFTGYSDKYQSDYVAWRLQAIAAINELGATAAPILKELEKDKQGPYFFQESAQRVLGSLRAALPIYEHAAPEERKPVHKLAKRRSRHKVFLVHGHDEVLLQQAARFIEKLDIEPIILFEQAGKGQTIIEKLETNADVAFAIVLFTPDDLGKSAKDEGASKPRARQNVVLELGYFIGKLGRPNVAVLYDESIELPSDYRGVEYIKIDAEGAWRLKLAREIKAAGLDLDMNKAI